MNIVTNGIVPESAVRVSEMMKHLFICPLLTSVICRQGTLYSRSRVRTGTVYWRPFSIRHRPLFSGRMNIEDLLVQIGHFLIIMDFCPRTVLSEKRMKIWAGIRIRCSSRMMKKMFCRVLLPIWYTVNAEDVVRSEKYWPVKAQSIAMEGLRD